MTVGDGPTPHQNKSRDILILKSQWITSPSSFITRLILRWILKKKEKTNAAIIPDFLQDLPERTVLVAYYHPANLKICFPIILPLLPTGVSWRNQFELLMQSQLPHYVFFIWIFVLIFGISLPIFLHQYCSSKV